MKRTRTRIIGLPSGNHIHQTTDVLWIKNPMSPEHFDSRTKAPPAKRSEKGYGDQNN